MTLLIGDRVFTQTFTMDPPFTVWYHPLTPTISFVVMTDSDSWFAGFANGKGEEDYYVFNKSGPEEALQALMLEFEGLVRGVQLKLEECQVVLREEMLPYLAALRDNRALQGPDNLELSP